jgi:signal peptidase I
MRSGNLSLRSSLIAILSAILIALLIRWTWVEAYRIPNSSMQPTLLAGDTIFVSKSAFGIRLPFLNEPLTSGRTPRRGEVILYEKSSFEQSQVFVRRVLAIAGDEISIRKGKVYLNQKPLTWAPGSETQDEFSCGKENDNYHVCWSATPLLDMKPIRVPEGSLFVLSDFRTALKTGDGIISLKSLRGTALRVWMSVEPKSLNPSFWFSRIRWGRLFQRIF